MDHPEEQVCPLCEHKNAAQATTCSLCGAPLDLGNQDRTTQILPEGESALLSARGDRVEAELAPTAIPVDGLAVFLEGRINPIAILKTNEFVIGRRAVDDTGEVLDLSPYGALELGVSRRHALVRKVVDGYEICDLDSTNGTWLSNKRMMPSRAYPLTSGSQVRLGQLLLLVFFSSP